MAAGVAARRAVGETIQGTQQFSQTKPEIYRTEDGKLIVEDELLNFIVIKMRTLSHDDIVSIVTSSFSSERIESSKAVLSELIPHYKRWISYRGQKKDTNNVKMCLQALNECGEEIPRFVSHFLDELPPVSFKHIDVSVLLGKMQQVNADIDCLKRTMGTQVAACETLREVSVKFDSRLTAVERYGGPDTTLSCDCPPAVELQPGLALGATGLPSTVLEKQLGPDPASCTTSGVNGWLTATYGRTGDDSQTAQSVDPAVGRIQTPSWSMVVKDGRRRKQVRLKQASENTAHRSPPPRAIKAPARQVRKKTGIIGTGVGSNILAVKTKMVKIFATKFDLSVDASTLSEYLKTKLGREVTCRKIEATQSRFSSFYVSAECNDVAELYDPQLWPAGAFVRCYYEPRHPRGADRGSSGPEGAPCSRDEGLLHDNDAGVLDAVVDEDGMKAGCSARRD